MKSNLEQISIRANPKKKKQKPHEGLGLAGAWGSRCLAVVSSALPAADGLAGCGHRAVSCLCLKLWKRSDIHTAGEQLGLHG